MGNSCACECLQDQDRNQQIQVKTNNTYHKDYTQPGNFKGGNQFLLLDIEEEDDKDKLQTTKQEIFREYTLETAEPVNGNTTKDQDDDDRIKKQGTVETVNLDTEGK
jgi:hypothetical protein